MASGPVRAAAPVRLVIVSFRLQVQLHEHRMHDAPLIGRWPPALPEPVVRPEIRAYCFRLPARPDIHRLCLPGREHRSVRVCEDEMLVATRCPACGRPHAWSVGSRRPPDGEQVAHFGVPAARMWDDVLHICGMEVPDLLVGDVRAFFRPLRALAPVAVAWGHQPAFVGDDDELGAVARVQLGHDAADVGLGGQRAEEQAGGDLVVGQALGDQPEDLTLAVGQAGQQPGRWAAAVRGGWRGR